MSTVIIFDYDPNWPCIFEVLRSRIAASVAGMAMAIEHVGSTAVPGLAAKPIVDIDVLLRSVNDLSSAITKLAGLGYVHRGDLGVAGREAFRTPPHHLYVCPPHSREYIRHISFRDYLRTHPQDARDYAHLKRELAAKYGDDREGYTQGKREFIEEILQRANATHPPARMPSVIAKDL